MGPLQISNPHHKRSTFGGGNGPTTDVPSVICERCMVRASQGWSMDSLSQSCVSQCTGCEVSVTVSAAVILTHCRFSDHRLYILGPVPGDRVSSNPRIWLGRNRSPSQQLSLASSFAPTDCIILSWQVGAHLPRPILF